jgi:hypothetical protein
MVARAPGTSKRHLQLGADHDEAVLAKLGYKQEFRREFTPLEVGLISDFIVYDTI